MKKLVSKTKEKLDQMELFVPSAQELSLRDQRDTMERPFLALSKRRKTPIDYRSPNGEVWVRVTPNMDHYVASIHDWDYIIVIASIMLANLNLGIQPSRTIRISAYELLKSAGRDTGGKAYKDLYAGLDRLTSTLVKTNIRRLQHQESKSFSFIDSWDFLCKGDNSKAQLQITISQWLYDGICDKAYVLSVHPDYFSLTSGIKRFLYRTARKHAGRDGALWQCSLKSLHEKSGSEMDIRDFKKYIKKSIIDNDIPEYHLTFIEESEDAIEGVSFVHKKHKFYAEEIDKKTKLLLDLPNYNTLANQE
ncbi:replication initiator protein A [Nodosilinea sp. LEGE 07298]|uniref:replication initiator protein A n=1 Tax=Nodosilinea sp. LEGE 07298 TaxID=2777970 RepID=UPI00187EAF04|nr:replication initiator protein A [Nodosilinea sp. LEGE 07298]MBE9110663.1 replication initiator protein A [Nodosilinea sp. LEGE 07298]